MSGFNQNYLTKIVASFHLHGECWGSASPERPGVAAAQLNVARGVAVEDVDNQAVDVAVADGLPQGQGVVLFKVVQHLAPVFQIALLQRQVRGIPYQ